MKYRIISVVIGMAILAVAIPCFGKVFWTWRSGSGTAVFDTTPGWRRVYQATVRINGSQGHLDIVGCDEALRGVMAKLQNAYASESPDTVFRQSESSGWGFIRANGNVTRILTLALGSEQPILLFVLTQSRSDYDQSLQLPGTHLLRGIPAYPQSVVQTFLEDEEARAELEISTAPVHPDSVSAFFQSALVQNGYRLMHSTTAPGPAGAGLSIFQKGMDICCVLVRASHRADESVITVLHKQLRME